MKLISLGSKTDVRKPQAILSIEDTDWTPSNSSPVGGCIYRQALGSCGRSLTTSWLLRKRRRLRKHGLLWIVTFWKDEGVMGWTRVGLRPRWLQSCPLTPAAATEQEPVRRRDREAPPQSQFLQYACGADYCAMLRSWQMSCELNRVRCDCCRLDPVLSCLR